MAEVKSSLAALQVKDRENLQAMLNSVANQSAIALEAGEN
jgi:hypothetical protein